MTRTQTQEAGSFHLQMTRTWPGTLGWWLKVPGEVAKVRERHSRQDVTVALLEQERP